MKRMDYPLRDNNFDNEIAEVQQLISDPYPTERDATIKPELTVKTVTASEKSALPVVGAPFVSQHPSSSETAAEVSVRHVHKKRHLWLIPTTILVIGGGALLFQQQNRMKEKQKESDSTIPISITAETGTSATLMSTSDDLTTEQTRITTTASKHETTTTEAVTTDTSENPMQIPATASVSSTFIKNTAKHTTTPQKTTAAATTSTTAGTTTPTTSTEIKETTRSTRLETEMTVLSTEPKESENSSLVSSTSSNESAGTAEPKETEGEV